jgi:hypothetical protein
MTKTLDEAGLIAHTTANRGAGGYYDKRGGACFCARRQQSRLAHATSNVLVTSVRRVVQILNEAVLRSAVVPSKKDLEQHATLHRTTYSLPILGWFANPSVRWPGESEDGG